MYSEAVVQLRTPQFLLFVLPNQLQFTPGEQVQDQQGLIQEKVGRIVERLPHTPYTAVGLNFVWHVRDDEAGIEQLSRELFFKTDSELCRCFDAPDAKFGMYLSRDLFGCRLKLDIKPIVVNGSDQPEMQRLQFAFNFHKDLADSGEPVRQIQEMLGRWDEIAAESRRIVKSLERRA